MFRSVLHCALVMVAGVCWNPPTHGWQDQGSDSVTIAVINGFVASYDGWSSDEVLLDDQRRSRFIAACRKKENGLPDLTNDEICELLLKLRKRGGQLPAATKRQARDPGRDHLIPVAEISARRLHDELGRHTDAILVSSQCRKLFDSIAETVLPGCDKYLVRKTALQLRKTRRLKPELLARVTDWKLKIREDSVPNLAANSDEISERPGIYIFRDASGYLYIGQASNLRRRLSEHLEESDRPALADYLTSGSADVRVEIHVFQPGSPGEQLAIRRAYESDLIRTRKPRLNLAP